MPRPRAPSYSSRSYWSTRLTTEQSFEWLLPSSTLLPIVHDILDAHCLPLTSGEAQPISGLEDRTTVEILHFGCGTSSLGSDLLASLSKRGVRQRVVDSDFVMGDIRSADSSATGNAGAGEVGSPILGREDGTCGQLERREIDVLSLTSLAASPERGWDLLLDKSTADAISTGPDLPLPNPVHAALPHTSSTPDTPLARGGDGHAFPTQREGTSVHPIQVLCRNLASVSHARTIWISISYSSTRYDGLPPATGWEVRERRFVRTSEEGKGPETGSWIYVLGRI